jgi:DNA repair photolyase
VDAKVNAAEVLEAQLKHSKRGRISLCTVTDPYQPLEDRYHLTQGCLRAVARYPAFSLSILTKSALVERDLDLLASMPNELEVGFSIATLDEALRCRVEPRSSPIEERLRVLLLLAERGLNTRVLYGPILPFLSDEEWQIEAMFLRLRNARVGRVMVDTLNCRPGVWNRLQPVLEHHYPDLVEDYCWVVENRALYLDDLRRRVARLARRCDLNVELLFDRVYKRDIENPEGREQIPFGSP